MTSNETEIHWRQSPFRMKIVNEGKGTTMYHLQDKKLVIVMIVAKGYLRFLTLHCQQGLKG